jgi:septal ring factor EnvC (AmiA/AmiB activator)
MFLEPNKDVSAMNTVEEMDQFQLLEEKIDNLIELIGALKREKESLAEKVQIQEEKISNLSEQVERLKDARDKARQRIVSLLEKLEQIEI